MFVFKQINLRILIQTHTRMKYDLIFQIIFINFCSYQLLKTLWERRGFYNISRLYFAYNNFSSFILPFHMLIPVHAFCNHCGNYCVQISSKKELRCLQFTIVKHQHILFLYFYFFQPGKFPKMYDHCSFYFWFHCSFIEGNK